MFIMLIIPDRRKDAYISSNLTHLKSSILAYIILTFFLTTIITGFVGCSSFRTPSKFRTLMSRPEYRSDRWQQSHEDNTPSKVLYKTHLQFEMVYALAEDVISGAIDKKEAMWYLSEFKRVIDREIVYWRNEEKRGVTNSAIRHFTQCLDDYMTAANLLQQVIVAENSKVKKQELLSQARQLGQKAMIEAQMIKTLTG